MELAYEELELLIYKIALGKEILMVNNQFISLEHPSNEIKIKANILYKQAYDNALDEGLLSREELEELITDRGLYSREDELEVSKLQSKLEAQEILLSKTLKVKANQDRIKKIISELRNEIAVIQYKKYSKLYMSAENKADEERNAYICSECVYKEDGTKYWGSYNDYLNEADEKNKNTIFLKYVSFSQGISIEVMRFIARSTTWRIRYNTGSKNLDKLFDLPSTSYDTNQLNLVYWSNYYDQVYNMMPSDRPSDDVIEDDELLDSFMNEYYKELNNEASVLRGRKVKNKGALSAFDSEEVIVTQSNELYFDIDYDKPREAQKVKDRLDIKKRTRRKAIG